MKNSRNKRIAGWITLAAMVVACLYLMITTGCSDHAVPLRPSQIDTTVKIEHPNLLSMRSRDGQVTYFDVTTNLECSAYHESGEGVGWMAWANNSGDIITFFDEAHASAWAQNQCTQAAKK